MISTTATAEPTIDSHMTANTPTPTRHCAGAPSVVNLARRRRLADRALRQRVISTGCPVSLPGPSSSRAKHGCLRSQPPGRLVILPAHDSQTRDRSRRCGRLLSECLCTEMSAVMLPSARKSTGRLIDMSVGFVADRSVREPNQQTRGDVVEVDRRCTVHPGRPHREVASDWIARARLVAPHRLTGRKAPNDLRHRDRRTND